MSSGGVSEPSSPRTRKVGIAGYDSGSITGIRFVYTAARVVIMRRAARKAPRARAIFFNEGFGWIM